MKEPPLPVSVGQVIDGKYRVERVIGSGGMGVVVAAEHLKLGKIVALKFLLKHACENREAVSRFLREGQALARITSAHVAHVMDVGTLEQGEPYLVMEYLEGSDLGAVLKRRGPMPISDAASYLLQACDAIAEAHANGIVHRDLKPSNLFLTRGADGVPLVKVLDFGISKAVAQRTDEAVESAGPDDKTAGVGHDTNTGALVGSPLYMSPEQIRNARRVDERTDVWSLGVILHELVCGKPPFEGETLSGTLAAVAADPPRSMSASRSDIPAELEAMVLRCLQKSPDKRFQSVADLARALERFVSGDARATVERISRLLSASGRGANPDAPSAEPAGDSGRTVPSWEGDTARMTTLTPWLKKRAPVLLGASALVALGAVAVVYERASRSPGSLPPESPSHAAAAAPALPVEPSRESTPPLPLSAPSVAPASAPAASAPAPSVAASARLTRAAKQAVRPPTQPATAAAKDDQDGTADRK